MPGRVVKRTVTVAGHKTSASMEAAYWDGLKDIAARRGISLNAIVTEIDHDRERSLSSALRLFVLAHFRAEFRAAEFRAAEFRNRRGGWPS